MGVRVLLSDGRLTAGARVRLVLEPRLNFLMENNTMDIAGKFDTFFMDKEERENAKKVRINRLRADYASASEDLVKSNNRTAEAFKQLKTTCIGDSDLDELVSRTKSVLACPF